MIRVKCPGCGSRLQAQERLAGKAAKCPKCGTKVAIPKASEQQASDQTAASAGEREPAAADQAPAGQQVVAAAEEQLPIPVLPERLDRQAFYLICDRSKLIATWEHNGQGWQINVGTGFASAARNSDRLPNQGDFKLVELILENTEQGRRLVGIHCYALARYWALPALARGDDAIIDKLTGPAGLTREQKDLIRQVLRERFMPEVWRDARAVLDYLASTDYHSPGTE